MLVSRLLRPSLFAMRFHPSQPLVRVCFSRGRVLLGVTVAGLLLGGCVAPVIEAASTAVDRRSYETNIEAARAGDAKAQYVVGNALCCSTFDRQPFYDTKLSIEWLCRSARQGQVPAMTRLARIYADDTVNGVRILRRALALLTADTATDALAWAWFRLAQSNGDGGAASSLDRLKRTISVADRAEGERLFSLGLAEAPCPSDAFSGH